jgi:hypothetical protein
MHLLERNEAGKISLTTFGDDHVPPYAIISHTWGREKVLFKDMVDSVAEGKPGYHKIQFCADQAWRDGLRFFWMDTCCIDRANCQIYGSWSQLMTAVSLTSLRITS